MLAIWGGLLLALGCGTKTPQFQFNFAEQRAQLQSNGLRVVVLPDATTELVEVDVRYQVGSSSDPEGKAGLAHFVEHLMFLQRPEGASSPPLMHYIQRTTTFFNAYTNWDTTHYMALGRKENLENFLQIEAMRLFYGCQTITPEEFEREREVVRNEIRQRTGTPEGQIQQLILSDVYPKAHAYARSIGGNDEQLSNITLKDACDFIARHYVPANATLIVAGNTNREEVVGLVQKWFGKLDRKPGNTAAKAMPLSLARNRTEHEVDVERPRLYVAWALPPRGTKDGDVAAFSIGQLLGRVAFFGNRWDFATSLNPQIVGGAKAPVFVIAIELRDEGKRSQALEFVWKAARRAGAGMQYADLDIQKVQQRARFITDLESLTQRTNLLGDLVQFYNDVPWNSDDQLWRKRFQAIDELDGVHVASVVKRVLDPKRAVVIDIKASAAGIKGDARSNLQFATATQHDDRQRTAVSGEGANKPFPLPQNPDFLARASRFTLDNGMRVVLISSSNMPVISARMSFAAGWAHEPDDKAGLARVTARMLQPPGFGGIVRQFVRAQGDARTEYSVIEAEVVDIYLDALLEELERRVKAGRYSQESIERWQKQMRYQFQSKRYWERQRFADEFRRAVFGPEHPYAVRGTVTEKSLAKIGRDAAMTFRNKHYSAANATLVLAGNVDVTEAEKLIRKRFSGWNKGHRDEPVGAPAEQRTQPSFVGVVTEKRPQMQVAIAYPGPVGVDAGLANRLILSEMLNVRMGDVRQELGASYGVYARWSPGVGPSLYNMGGNVDAPRAGEALAAMRKGIEAVRTGYDGFDADFVHARRRVVQGLLGQSTVSSAVAARLETIARFELPPDHYSKLLRQVAVTRPIQVQALAQKELRPEREIVVCAADRETLTRAFAEAGLQEPRLVEPK